MRPCAVPWLGKNGKEDGLRVTRKERLLGFNKVSVLEGLIPLPGRQPQDSYQLNPLCLWGKWVYF